ncbi:MAG: FtsQ-type POTRA domain-containing protein [Myxococcota bacterium]
MPSGPWKRGKTGGRRGNVREKKNVGKRSEPPKNRAKPHRVRSAPPLPRNSKKPPPPVPKERVPLRKRAKQGKAAAVGVWQRVRRPLLIGLRIAVAVAALVGAVAAAGLIEDHVRTSPAFRLEEVSLIGDERLSREEILASAGLELGQNIFEVGPEDSKARLLAHPWIADAQVSRRLPNAFDIEIREHTAVLIVALTTDGRGGAGGLYLVSEDGAPFKRVADGDPVDLPVVTGFAPESFAGDGAYRTSLLLEAVGMLHDYRGAGLYRREPIAEIHIEPDDGLSLYIGAEGVHVRLGRGPYRQKLRRLRRVLDRLAQEGTPPAYIYIDNVRRPDRVTVRLRPLPPAPVPEAPEAEMEPSGPVVDGA